MKKLVLVTAALTMTLAAGSAAAADDSAEFGSKGVLAIGAITGLTFGYANVSPPQGTSNSVVTISLTPQLAYFVIDGLSLGGDVGFSYTKPKDQSTTVISIGPRIGYNAWITPGTLSIWPQAGFSYASSSSSVDNGTGGTSSVSASTFSLVAFVPLLIHPVRHFHFGIGPYFSTDLSSSQSIGGTSADGAKTTAIGIRGEIGGWL